LVPRGPWDPGTPGGRGPLGPPQAVGPWDPRGSWAPGTLAGHGPLGPPRAVGLQGFGPRGERPRGPRGPGGNRAPCPVGVHGPIFRPRPCRSYPAGTMAPLLIPCRDQGPLASPLLGSWSYVQCSRSPARGGTTVHCTDAYRPWHLAPCNSAHGTITCVIIAHGTIFCGTVAHAIMACGTVASFTMATGSLASGIIAHSANAYFIIASGSVVLPVALCPVALWSMALWLLAPGTVAQWTMVGGPRHMLIWAPGYQLVTPGRLGSCMLGSWLVGYLGFLAPWYLSAWAAESLGTRPPGRLLCIAGQQDGPLYGPLSPWKPSFWKIYH